MVRWTRGATYSGSEKVDATRLHDLVDKSKISLIRRADFSTDTRPISIGTTAPSSPVTGELWFDTNISVLKRYDGTNWVTTARGMMMTNGSGGNLVTGDVVVLHSTTGGSVTTTTTAGDLNVVGVVLHNGNLADGSSGVVLTDGFASVLVASQESVGTFLRTSTTAKKATAGIGTMVGNFALVAAQGPSGGGLTSCFLRSARQGAV